MIRPSRRSSKTDLNENDVSGVTVMMILPDRQADRTVVRDDQIISGIDTA